MIKDSSIQLVLQTARIEEVIGKFVDLKKAGTNFKGLSPFTQEKTPSFVVSPAKQIFKCFSSGIGGGVVKFLEEHKQLTFPEAMNYLADMYNITLEETEDKRTEEDRNHEDDLRKTLKAAVKQWQEYLLNEESRMLYLTDDRKFTHDTILQWGLGAAPAEWRFLTEKIINSGMYAAAKDLGICNHKNERNYDVIRNRIVFPIHDHRGQLVGYGARTLGEDGPKYLNSPDNPIYNKSFVLYGLNFAAAAIKKAGFAYLVEGYTDVISMHQAGVENTVAGCGTAVTESQLKLLGRYCNHVVVLTDGDAAGLRAAEKIIIAGLQLQMRMDIVVLDKDEDPDTLARKYKPAEIEINETELVTE